MCGWGCGAGAEGHTDYRSWSVATCTGFYWVLPPQAPALTPSSKSSYSHQGDTRAKHHAHSLSTFHSHTHTLAHTKPDTSTRHTTLTPTRRMQHPSADRTHTRNQPNRTARAALLQTRRAARPCHQGGGWQRSATAIHALKLLTDGRTLNARPRVRDPVFFFLRGPCPRRSRSVGQGPA